MQIIDQFACSWKLYDIFKMCDLGPVKFDMLHGVFLFSFPNVTISSTWLETVAQTE